MRFLHNDWTTIQVKAGEKHIAGAYDLTALYLYTFPDGRAYCENVQAVDLAALQVFLALKDCKTGEWVKESLWPREITGPVPLPVTP